MLRKSLIFVSFASLMAACSTISEESCIAGSWESLGYEDGRDGESRGHFTKIAETCAKYGISANAAEYRIGYDQGLPLYCSYDKGLKHGESGSSVKTECREISAYPYLDGYDEGRAIYETEQAYDRLLDDYKDIRKDLEEVSRVLHYGVRDKDEKRRLWKKKYRLEDELDESRIEIRAFERIEGWPRRDLQEPNFNFEEEDSGGDDN